MSSIGARYIVDDVDASIAFSCGQLGFTEVMHPAPAFATLTRDGLRLSEIARLSDAGLILRSRLIEGIGGRQVLVADPSGNLVELFQPTRDEARL